MGLDCGECGLKLPGDAYYDDERITCADCKAVNVISVDEDGDVGVGHWYCEHGKHDTEPCDLCEIEKGGGVGEVAP